MIAPVSNVDLLESGHSAFVAGDWLRAVEALQAIRTRPARSSEELATARWWLDDPKGAIAAWEESYGGYRDEGDVLASGRIAVTIAREYTAALGNPVAANGWLVKARAHAEDEPSVAAWIALADAERATDPTAALDIATSALASARA